MSETRIPLSDAAVQAVAAGEVVKTRAETYEDDKQSPYLIALADKADAAYEKARFFTQETNPENGRPWFRGPAYVILLDPDQLGCLTDAYRIVTVEAFDGATRTTTGTFYLLRATSFALKTEYGVFDVAPALTSELREGDLFTLSAVARSNDSHWIYRVGLVEPPRLAYSRGTKPGLDWPANATDPLEPFADEVNAYPTTALHFVVVGDSLRQQLADGAVTSEARVPK